jgi:TPR repeat protein
MRPSAWKRALVEHSQPSLSRRRLGVCPRPAETLIIFFAFFLTSSPALSSPPRGQSSNSPAPITEAISRAESGDSSAQRYLQTFLADSDPTIPGYAAAVTWLRTNAAENPPLLCLLGFLYEHGHGLPQNYAKAFENYQAAARLGNGCGQNNLASLYQHGLGVSKNLGKAAELYLASAKQGNPVAQCNLAELYFTGSGVPRDLSEGVRWFRAAAERGYPAAQHNLAVLYFKGLGVPMNYAEAVIWERLAADQGFPDAEAGLGYIYETGKGVSLDYVAAFAWYSRASAHGDRRASERCKSLSHLMTHKQLDEAKGLFSKPRPD